MVPKHLFLSIKFYWNAVMPIPFCAVLGCFCTMAEASSCHCVARKVVTTWPFTARGMAEPCRSLGPRMTAWVPHCQASLLGRDMSEREASAAPGR